SLREHATNARRRFTTMAIPSGSRPTGISAICRHGYCESVRHAPPTGNAGSSLEPVAAIYRRVSLFADGARRGTTTTPVRSFPGVRRASDLRRFLPLRRHAACRAARGAGSVPLRRTEREPARLQQLDG